MLCKILQIQEVFARGLQCLPIQLTLSTHENEYFGGSFFPVRVDPF